MEPPDQVRTDTDTTMARGALAPGVRLRQYEIRSVLGQGGFGITYLGRDMTLNRDVAIKEYLPTALALREAGETVVPRSTATAPDFLNGRERFLDEARTLARLDSMPSIVRVLDFLEANGTAYMIMALARGETLAARLRREGRLNADAIGRLLPSLLEGLEGVHNAGFLHRDIKPANILIDSREHPTLIDFGASRAALAGASVALTAVFTPGYAAVEQMTSAKQGPPTDIYGLAATLHHCVMGSPPPSAFDRVLSDNYVPLSKIAPGGYGAGLLAAIDVGLAVRAADRPQTIAEWRPMLLAQGSPDFGHDTVAMPRDQVDVQTRARVLPPKNTRRMIYLAGAVALVIAVAGLAGYYLLGAGPSQPKPVALQDLKVEDLERALAERRKADAEAAEKQRQAEEAQRKAEAEAAAKRQADADLERARVERQKAEEELAQLKAQIEARRKEATEQKLAANAAAQRAAEEEAKVKAEAEMAALKAAEAEARKKADDEAVARQQAEAAQVKADAERKRAEDAAAARVKAEADAKAKADAEGRAKADAEAVETAMHLATADRQRLQVALSAVGFDTRGSDGVFGPHSREMIAAWQKTRNELPTGFLTAAQSQALLKEPAVVAALAKYDADQKKLDEDKKKAEEEAKAKMAPTAVPAPGSTPPPSQQSAAAVAPPPAAPTAAPAQPVESKQLSLPNTAGTGCVVRNNWSIRIHPQRVDINIRGVWQPFEADSSGQFAGQFQATSGAHWSVAGNLTARTITFVNVSYGSCTFAGKF